MKKQTNKQENTGLKDSLEGSCPSPLHIVLISQQGHRPCMNQKGGLTDLRFHKEIQKNGKGRGKDIENFGKTATKVICPVVYNPFGNKTRKGQQTGRKGRRVKGRALGGVENGQEGWQDCSRELRQQRVKDCSSHV